MKYIDCVVCAVYIFHLSLLPLWRAVAHLQYTLDVRHANPGYQVKVLDFPILQDALAIAILKLIISFIGTLRPVVNVLCNPQGEDSSCSWLLTIVVNE